MDKNKYAKNWYLDLLENKMSSFGMPNLRWFLEKSQAITKEKLVIENTGLCTAESGTE